MAGKKIAAEEAAAAKYEEKAMESKEEVNCTGATSAGFSVYIGPSINGVINHGKIIRGCPEEAMKVPEIQLAISGKPEIKKLIVDGAALSKCKEQVKTKGEDLYKAYQSIIRKK